MTSIPAAAIASPSVSSPVFPVATDQVRAVTRDSDNRLHIVWIDQTPADRSGLFYQVRDLSGVALTPAILIYESGERIRRPHIAVDHNHVVHLLWQERFAKGAGARLSEGTWVHYAQLNTNNTPSPVVLREEILNRRPIAMHPDLAVDAQGAAYSVWEEGEQVVMLARIVGQRPIEQRQITANFGKERHGYPAVAADGRGNIHVAWTNADGSNNKQIVYTMFRPSQQGVSRDLSAFAESPVQSLYTSAPVFGQPKSIAVEPTTGRITITWRNQRERGPMATMASAPNSITVSPAVPRRGAGQWKQAKVLSVHDVTLSALPSLATPAMPLAIIGKPIGVAVAEGPGIRVAPPHDLSSTALRRYDGAIEKSLLEQLLEFSSWSGAPPAGTAFSSLSVLLAGRSSSPSLVLPFQLFSSSVNSVVPSAGHQFHTNPLQEPGISTATHTGCTKGGDLSNRAA